MTRLIYPFPLSVVLAVMACSDPLNCTLRDCVGNSIEVELVDELGAPVAAKGEFRDEGAGLSPARFDCTAGPALAAGEPLPCSDGIINTHQFPRPNQRPEVRFELRDGTFSEWQRVPLQLEEKTIRDFNGAGCHCTYYDPTVAPVVVPTSARSAA